MRRLNPTPLEISSRRFGASPVAQFREDVASFALLSFWVRWGNKGTKFGEHRGSNAQFSGNVEAKTAPEVDHVAIAELRRIARQKRRQVLVMGHCCVWNKKRKLQAIIVFKQSQLEFLTQLYTKIIHKLRMKS